jgi:hypothetical protein
MRSRLFSDEPVAELRGLATLTDPDDDVTAVIDVPVIGARGDGKTQFIVHAIRALRAHAPALAGAEQGLNRDVLRVVLDPRAPRPDATPPGVVPHFTFRVRTSGMLGRVGLRGAARLVRRAARTSAPLVVGALLVIAGAAVVATHAVAAGGVMCGGGLALAAIGALVARKRLAQLGDLEIAFWDVAGEHVYSSTAADYYALLSCLVDARRRRAAERGRAYVFAPVLICNPITLGTSDEGSPYERLRQLLPLFAALDSDGAHAMVAINRWRIVDPICERGMPRDQVVTVTACAHGEPPSPPREVARDLVRSHCLDAEDGKDGEVHVSYLRYDTALKSSVEVDSEAGTVAYDYDDGPGAFSGKARHRFLDWLVELVPWHVPQPDTAQSTVPVSPPAAGTVPAQALGSVPPYRAGAVTADLTRVVPGNVMEAPPPAAATEAVWSRPFDASRPR